jgi:MFS family permease
MEREAKLSPALWRLLALLMLSVVINYIDRGTLSTAAPLLKNELGLNAAQLGILLSSFFWTYAGFMVIAGWLADHADVNWVLATGLFIWCAATVATGFAHGFVALLIARLVLGMGESVSYPCYCTLLARHFTEHRRGFASAVLNSGLGFGPAVGMFACGPLMARYGWPPVFIGLGSIGLLWLPAWLRWMPRTQAPSSFYVKQAPPSLQGIIKQRSIWGSCIGHSCETYLSYLLLTWTPLYLISERHFSMYGMAMVAGAAYLSQAVVGALAGWLADRWIACGGSVTLIRKTFVTASDSAAGIFLMLSAVAGPASSVALLLSSFACLGITNSSKFAIIQTLAGPRAAGKCFGIQNFFASLSGIVAPSVTGFVVYRTGHFLLAFAITAVVSVLGALSWLFLVGPVKTLEWEPKVVVAIAGASPSAA